MSVAIPACDLPERSNRYAEEAGMDISDPLKTERVT